MTTHIIGARIKALREERGLSQEDLARLFGFKDRQTVSAIETGARRLSAEELIVAVERLGAPLDYFTDPFRLDGEGRFSWRHSDVGADRLREYEAVAGSWIAAFRVIAPQVGRETPFLRRTLALTRRSRFEEAMAAGERFAREFGLGDVPAARLAGVMERELGVLVLNVDTIEGVSGAACRLPEFDTVLINRHESAGRRHFDLAHELFHILTWETMPPAHAEDAGETGQGRSEQLANNFASAVLMPRYALDGLRDWATLTRNEVIVELVNAASRFQVTATALKWRLVALGRLSRKFVKDIADSMLRGPLQSGFAEAPPPLFSKPFMEVLSAAIGAGRISIRRTAELADLTIDDLAELFSAHGVEAAIEI